MKIEISITLCSVPGKAAWSASSSTPTLELIYIFVRYKLIIFRWILRTKSTHGIPKQVKRGVTDPPTKMTDPITIRLVVVRKVCRALDIVLRIANAKAMAPRIP
jgi:hypothetical protein